MPKNFVILPILCALYKVRVQLRTNTHTQHDLQLRSQCLIGHDSERT
jgi:hypothetical protein